MILCRPLGRVTFCWANILILFLTTSMPLEWWATRLLSLRPIQLPSWGTFNPQDTTMDRILVFKSLSWGQLSLFTRIDTSLLLFLLGGFQNNKGEKNLLPFERWNETHFILQLSYGRTGPFYNLRYILGVSIVLHLPYCTWKYLLFHHHSNFFIITHQ